MNIRDEFHKPEWFANWKVFLLFSLISFSIAFGMRAMEYPKWDNPAFMVDGEYILGTHDAYCWLAGAKGVGKAVSNPMSGLVKLLGSVTGAPYGNIGFWLPAVFAGFTSVAAFAWGMLVAGPWIGVCAGVYATSIPMFYYRTRLSYYDTDLITLLFPLVISFLMAIWLNRGLNRSWLPAKADDVEFQVSIWDYLIPIAAGVCVSFGHLWHGDVLNFGLFTVVASALLVFLCGTKLSRSILLKGVALFALSSYGGICGAVVSLLVVYITEATSLSKNKKLNNAYTWLVVLAVVLCLSAAGTQILQLFQKFISYMKPISGADSTAAIHYPGIAQSVIEAQNIQWEKLFYNLTGSPYLSGLGLIGYLFLLCRRPCTVLLLPFAVMSLAAVKLGGRFSMFSGAVIGLGGAFFLCWLMYRFLTLRNKKTLCEIVASTVMVALLLINVLPDYLRTTPTPIIYQEHAKALKVASKFAPADSTFWTWWDWGYATMYFTGRKSFADGSRHGGSLLYPLAFAYTTPSYLQSNQFMKYCAEQNGNPANAWGKMDVNDVKGLIYSMGAKQLGFKNEPKQYVVTSWSDVRLAYWILFYGSFDLATGKGTHPEVSRMGGGFNLDRDNAKVVFNDGAVIPISGYDIASHGLGETRVYQDGVGPYLILNNIIGQAFFVDEFARNSLLLKLLLANPSAPEVKSNFKLIYDGYPMVRIYEVL